MCDMRRLRSCILARQLLDKIAGVMFGSGYAIDTMVISVIFHTVDTTVVHRPHDRYGT